jgi:hypothetical protein
MVMKIEKDPEDESLRAFLYAIDKVSFWWSAKIHTLARGIFVTLTVVAPVNTPAFLFLRLSLTTSLVSRPRVFSASRHCGIEIFTTAIDTLAAVAGGRRSGLTITGIRGWMMTGRFHQEAATG